MKNFFIKKNRQTIAGLSIIVAIAACGLFSLHDAYAQQSMSGGGYTLNGGLTVFTSELSGGGYTLGPTGDPVAGQSSGGGYALMPTPYSTDGGIAAPSTPGSGSGGSDGGGVSSGGATGGGYTYYPASSTNATSMPFYPNESAQGQNKGQNPAQNSGQGQSRPVFNPDRPSTGMEWIDDGDGVDLDFDGSPDIFASGTPGTPGLSGSNDGKDMPATSSAGSLIRTYDNDLTPLRAFVTALFILCICFAPIIRKKDESPASEGGVGSMHIYRVSRLPLAIFIDYLIALHRSKSDSDLNHPGMRNLSMEQGLQAFASEHGNGRTSGLVLLDAIIAPALTILCIAWSWPISWALGIVFIAFFAIRLLIGKKILD